MFIWIGNGFPDLFYVILFNQSTGRTMIHTLSAVGANHIIHRFFEKCGYFHLVAFVSNSQCIHPLEFGTGSHTALTTNTFAVVFHNRRRKHIDGIIFQRCKFQEILGHNFIFRCKFLQLAVSISVTFGAVGIVFCQ